MYIYMYVYIRYKLSIYCQCLCSVSPDQPERSPLHRRRGHRILGNPDLLAVPENFTALLSGKLTFWTGKSWFCCLISGLTMVYGRYNYSSWGFTNQLITGGPILYVYVKLPEAFFLALPRFKTSSCGDWKPSHECVNPIISWFANPMKTSSWYVPSTIEFNHL